MVILQASESRVFNYLQSKLGQVCSRDEVAQALWGEQWTQKYSDWMIDTLVYRLRHKVPGNLEIRTLRNQGYVLVKKGYESVGTEPTVSILKPVPGIQATEAYLNYMNDPGRVRRGLNDLFVSVRAAGLARCLRGKVLVINSYSFDNVDAVKVWSGEVVFTHFDERALSLHRRRVEELNLKNISVLYDDIRQSRLAGKTFDLVINDFRLNFNSDHFQNRQMVRGMKRVLKPGGHVLISAVFGQRKGWFMADEKLARPCWPLVYYRKLFRDSGFKIVQEFDAKAGDSWYQQMSALKPGFEPRFRRWLLG